VSLPKLFNMIDGLMFAATVGLAALGLFLAAVGELPWWHGLFFTLCAAVLLVPRDLAKRVHVDDLEVSDWGIRRTFGHRWRAKKVEAVAWDALSEVEIVTNGLGPGAEDMFFVLHGSGNRGAVVPGALALKHRLLEELQRRLPGLDNRAVVEASGCITNARFLVWQRNRSEATRG
jgi:hypothetical protein